MSRTRNIRWLLVATLFAACAALPSARLHASHSYGYVDLDSLVHLSTDVAEVEITRRFRFQKMDLIEVTAMLVHKGGLKKGQIVAVRGTDDYRKLKKGDLNAEPLAVGDHLVIFAERAEMNAASRIRDNIVVYAPLSCGMRFIDSDHVFDFFGRDKWGGSLVANLASDSPPAKLLTVERFRQQVRDSLRDTQEWARLVEAKPGKLDLPRLLKLLGDRSAEPYGGCDYFSERISMRFAESHDVDLLSRALALAKGDPEITILQRGFGTPKGAIICSPR